MDRVAEHTADHDPLVDYRRCWTCYQALSKAFTVLADMALGPKDADTLVRALRRALEDA